MATCGPGDPGYRAPEEGALIRTTILDLTRQTGRPRVFVARTRRAALQPGLRLPARSQRSFHLAIRPALSVRTLTALAEGSHDCHHARSGQPHHRRHSATRHGDQ